MRRAVFSFAVLFCWCVTLVPVHGQSIDSDGDGLLDLLDTPDFRQRISDRAPRFRDEIQDLDGASQLTSAIQIRLSANQITEIGATDFQGLTQLNKLDLSHNAISEIQPESFRDLQNLTELRLRGNQLRALPPGTFAGLDALEYLAVPNNALTTLDADSFGATTRLLRLDLMNNQIHFIGDGTFAETPNVTHLNIASNQLSHIQPAAFADSSQLETLDLSANRFATVPSELLSRLDSLESLSLSSNQILQIDSGIFEGAAALRDLNLSNNTMARIADHGFAGLSNLTSLSLANNLLVEIAEHTFSGMPNLTSLSLANNHIMHISRNGFSELFEIQSIDISNHKISNLSNSLAGLSKLEHLHLAGGLLTQIQADDFANLPELQHLDLTHNQITSIQSGAFRNKEALEQLYLSGNEMTTLNLAGAKFQSLTYANTFFDPWKIREVNLDEASLGEKSFDAIISRAFGLQNVSLIGLQFVDQAPNTLNKLLTINTLSHVSVDPTLYSRYAHEFEQFVAKEGKTLSIIQPGDMNRDNALDAADIDLMAHVSLSNPRDPVFDLDNDNTITLEDRRILIHEIFGTAIGDSNLDGIFDSQDLVQIFANAEFEDNVPQNSSWSTGDWNGDLEFDSADFVFAYTFQSPNAAKSLAVPEPRYAAMVGLLALGLRHRPRKKVAKN